MAPRWAEYRWTPGADWQVVDSIEESSKETVRSYFRQAIPMVDSTGVLIESRAKKLRALGYGQ